MLVIYAGPLTGMTFPLGTMLFAGVWNFGLAYQVGIVVSLDQRGNLAVLISSFLSLGAIVGPAWAGVLIHDSDYIGVFALTTIINDGGSSGIYSPAYSPSLASGCRAVIGV